MALTKVKGSGLATGAATASLVGIDDNATSTAITIDASENVMVGKSTTAIETVGTNLFSTGRVISTADGDDVAVLNRKTSDGDIAVFKKDGTTVGYVGTYGGDLTVGTGDTGVRFIDSLDTIVPISDSSGTSRDAAIDLGYSSIRYKDLYLSGSVYLGGTAAANALDDYEEGTWTPVIANYDGDGSATYSLREGTYRKIGSVVHIWYTAQLTAFTNTRASADILIEGLPFSSSTSGNMKNVGHLRYANCTTLDGNDNGIGTNYVPVSSTTIHLMDNINFPIEDGNLSGDEEFIGSLMYITN
jgi:hypothetical protein